MNKTELITAVAAKTGISKKEADKIIAATLDTIVETVKTGEKVSLVGFGVFEVKDRPARMGHNPRTNASIEIPASRVPQFKAGKALKDAVAE